MGLASGLCIEHQYKSYHGRLRTRLTITDEQQTDAGLVLDSRQVQVTVYIGQLGRPDVLSVEIILVRYVSSRTVVQISTIRSPYHDIHYH
jgi:hypothetical protein